MTSPLPWVVVTGASSGIGQAFAQRMAPHYPVLAVARRASALSAVAEKSPNIQCCAADIATEQGREAIANALSGAPVRYLVHNAGVLSPIGPLLEQDTDAIRYALAVNLEAPIALTRQSLPQMTNGGRVLHISSGAAHSAYPGWGAYCMSKAALYMAYQILNLELGELGVQVGSLRPGVVDTPMQTLIRAQNERDFPAVERFRELKTAGALTSPQAVAEFMQAVLETTTDAQFSAEEWDIRTHWSRVLPHRGEE